MLPSLGLLSKICVLISFILSILCLFAGSQQNFLQDASVMTLNTSASRPTSAIKAVETGSATDLGLRDFYSVYVLAYCEGYFVDGHRNVTSCSDRSAVFAFNPSDVFSSELDPGFNVSDIDWPDTITDDFSVMETTTKAMSVLYIIGAGATGMTLLMEILVTSASAGARQAMMAHLFFTVLSFVCLGISSSVASVIAVKFVELINRHGKDYGITATGGDKFLSMTWAAVCLVFVTVVISVITLPPGGGSPAPAEKEAEGA
ncbi:hypothetical protein VTN77DRAFT_7478 [Rasamsonia byssochlamydoides]|uniref:uncharacterized protein n=1 Tax=Rasamsonia byssochlamydoides TaxID=89139 RepID=UPI0037441A8A